MQRWVWLISTVRIIRNKMKKLKSLKVWYLTREMRRYWRKSKKESDKMLKIYLKELEKKLTDFENTRKRESFLFTGRGSNRFH